MDKKIQTISIRNIKINDDFWNRYISLVPNVIIPYQWKILNDQVEDVETSHGIANFKIAAGEEQGEFYGAVFQDTDVAKWLEAVAFSLASTPNPELEKIADEVIRLIGKAQQADGYINTYFTIKEPDLKFTNLRDGHELYTAGHLMEAAVAYYKSTGKREFVNIIQKFADLICNVFSDTNNKYAYPGHQEVEIGLYKLYEVTGEKKYLEQAKKFIDRRGMKPSYFEIEEKGPKFQRIFPEFVNYDLKYSQAHLPVMKQKTAEGHAVRATYMYSAMADIASEYEDETLLKACEDLWLNITKKRMYITGSIGSSGLLERFTTDYDLPNNSNYSETCASIGLAMFGRRMAQITRDAKYMDTVERALYNTVLAGISQDGKSFFYVNPLEVWPDNCINRTSKEHVKPTRQKWFGVACCPPNIARTLASLGEYIYFADHESIWINLFISNQAKFLINNTNFEITITTNYPNDGKIQISIQAEEKSSAKVALRIPDFVKEYVVYCDGAHINDVQLEKGYFILEQEFFHTTIDVELNIAPKIFRANPNVKEDIGKLAIMKGPLVYCLEETDNGTNLPAMYLAADEPLNEIYSKDIMGGTTLIKTVGYKVDQKQWSDEELYGESKLQFNQQELTFIPYPYWGNRKSGEMLVWVKEMFKM